MIVANIVPKLAIKAQMVKYFTLIYIISAKTGVFPLQICKKEAELRFVAVKTGSVNIDKKTA